MQEIKFNIYGEMFHSNGYSRNDILSFIAATREEALATCKRLYPKFHVMSIWEDESEVEVVGFQSLIWMKTTTATYSIEVTTDEGRLSFLKDMPTRPKTQKGIKSQNDKLSRWVEKEYPNFLSYHISLLS